MSLTINEPVQTGAPHRSLEQRREALARANEIRTWRAELKREIKAGRVDLIPLVLDPPEELETMQLFDLLLAAPKLGRVKVNQALQRARISPAKTIGGLSERQRREILHGLAYTSTHYRQRFARA